MKRKAIATAVAAAIKPTAKEKATAGELLQAGLMLGELAADYVTLVYTAVYVNGCTYEGMETAEADLPKVQAYRSAKSAFKAAKAEGVALVTAEGAVKGRTALETEVQAKRLKVSTVDAEGKPKGVNALRADVKAAKAAKAGVADKAPSVTPNATEGGLHFADRLLAAQFVIAALKAEPKFADLFAVDLMEIGNAARERRDARRAVRRPRSVATPVGATTAPAAEGAKVEPMSTPADRAAARGKTEGAMSLAMRQAMADQSAAARKVA
jgi:hypothetical protein